MWETLPSQPPPEAPAHSPPAPRAAAEDPDNLPTSGPTSPQAVTAEHLVAAAAVQMVADVFAQLGLQELQAAAAGEEGPAAGRADGPAAAAEGEQAEGEEATGLAEDVKPEQQEAEEEPAAEAGSEARAEAEPAAAEAAAKLPVQAAGPEALVEEQVSPAQPEEAPADAEPAASDETPAVPGEDLTAAVPPDTEAHAPEPAAVDADDACTAASPADRAEPEANAEPESKAQLRQAEPADEQPAAPADEQAAEVAGAADEPAPVAAAAADIQPVPAEPEGSAAGSLAASSDMDTLADSPGEASADAAAEEQAPALASPTADPAEDAAAAFADSADSPAAEEQAVEEQATEAPLADVSAEPAAEGQCEEQKEQGEPEEWAEGDQQAEDKPAEVEEEAEAGAEAEAEVAAEDKPAAAEEHAAEVEVVAAAVELDTMGLVEAAEPQAEAELQARLTLEAATSPSSQPQPEEPLPECNEPAEAAAFATGQAQPDALPAGTWAAASQELAGNGVAAPFAGMVPATDAVAAVEAYGQALEREVSAKLQAVLSVQQLQEQEAEETDEHAQAAEEEPAGASAAASPSLGLLPVPQHGLASAAASPAMAPTAQPVAEQAAGMAAPQGAPLLKWAAAPKKASPHLRKAVAGPSPAATSPGHLSAAGIAGGLPNAGSSASAAQRSPTQRMAPLSGSSPTAIAGRASGASRTMSASKAVAGIIRSGSGQPAMDLPARQRRLSKPSMNEILASAGLKARPARQHRAPAHKHLATAPPPSLLPGAVPIQLAAGSGPAPFPALAETAPGALLHWGPKRAGGSAAAAPGPVAVPAGGWFVPAPVAWAPQGYLVPAGGVFMPVTQAAVPPTELAAPGEQAAGLPEEAGNEPAAGGPAGAGGAEGEGQASVGQQGGQQEEGQEAEGQEAEGQALPSAGDGEQAEGEEERAHPYAPDSGQEAAAAGYYAACQLAQPQYDVAASWPPYEGAKLPPLYQDQVTGAGLIPAMHAVASFSVAPSRQRNPSAGTGLAQQRPWGGPAALSWRSTPQQLSPQQMAAAPAGYYVPAGAGWVPPGQFVAAGVPGQWGMGGAYGMPSGFQGSDGGVQEAAYYHHQQQYGQQYQQEGQDSDGSGGMHEDGPLFYRDPPPQVPVALDACGRPFKVFHGVVARSLRRPERYQGDGRPAWSAK